MKKYLYVPIETKVREFDAKLLLALHAVREGWTVVIGRQQSLKMHLHRYPRGVFLAKAVSISQRQWFARCRNMGHSVIAWDEEGLVYFDSKTLHDIRLDAEALRMVDHFFAWGEDQKEAMQTELPGLATPITVTGNPRFDLLRPEFRKLYAESDRHLHGRYGRFILVNTSFPFANHFLGEEAMRGLHKKYAITQRRPDFFTEWGAVHAAGLRRFRDLVPRLAEAFRDHTIIVRPHPSENHENWREWLRGIAGVEVIAEGPIVEWIHAADCIIHSDCTSGIESFVLERPPIAYEQKDETDYRQPLPYALSLHATSKEEVLDLVRQAVDHSLKLPHLNSQRLQVAHHHISAMDGPLACQRILDQLNGYTSKRTASRFSQFRETANAEWVLWRERRQARGRSDLYDTQKFPATHVEEVRERLHALSEAAGLCPPSDIQAFGDTIFKIMGTPGQ